MESHMIDWINIHGGKKLGSINRREIYWVNAYRYRYWKL